MALSVLLGGVLTLSLLSLSHVSGSLHGRRTDEVSRIGEYELVSLVFDSDTNILSFSGFGNDYKLALKLNEKLVASNIKRTNGVPAESSGYFTSLTKSCHYHVRDASVAASSVDDHSIHGGVSMCNKRGVRGLVTAFNETIMIRPANYYLDFDIKHHDIADTHLIYRVSDYDTTGYPVTESMSIDTGDVNVNKTVESIRKSHMKKQKTKNSINNFVASSNSGRHSRKLTAYNDGVSDVEMYMFCDAGLYLEFYADYGDDWYDELESYMLDVVSLSANQYEITNWGNDIGSVSISLVELEVATDFSGIYASLNPTATTPNSYDSVSCSDWTDVDGCTQDSGWHIGVFKTWVNTYKSWDDFDNAAAYTGYGMSSARGYFPGMCSTNSVVNVPQGWQGWDVHAMDHEVGHNFWMDHDQDTTCGNDGGLMGYGSNWDEFSECSIASMNDLFDRDGLDCLGDGVRSFSGGSDDDSTCDDGCEIDSGYWSDGYCDCSNCEDEDSWECSTCTSTGCPTSCGGYSYCDGSGTVDTTTFTCDDGCVISSGYMSDNYCDCSNCEDEVTTDWTCNDCSVYGCPASCGGYAFCDGSGTGMRTADLDCSYYNCIGLFSFDDFGVDVTGEWEPAGCFNGEAYYTGTVSNGDTWYIYYGTSYGGWHVHNELTDDSATYFCYDTPIDCDYWYKYDSGWYNDADAMAYECSGSSRSSIMGKSVSKSDFEAGNSDVFDFTLTDNCTNPYGDYVCIYNSGLLWNNGVSTFKFEGCKDDVPFFYYTYMEGNYSLRYFLHYEESDWVISERTMEDTGGAAHCSDTSDLNECTYGTWNVLMNEEDMTYYEIDESMGMDSDCQSVNIDNSAAHCDDDDDDSTNTCALWGIYVHVEEAEVSSSSVERTVLCSDDIVECISESFLSEWSEMLSTNLVCHSDYAIGISMNITFSNVLGYSIYSSFMSGYDDIVETCVNSDDSTFSTISSEAQLTSDIVYSTLSVCDSCDAFLTAIENDDDESESETSGVSGTNSYDHVSGAMLLLLISSCCYALIFG